MAYTKECLGATDAQMGNVKPDNTSALMVLQSSAEVPLENIRAGLYEWMEDIGAILLDMMGTYYGERPVVRERDFEEPVVGANGSPLIDPMTGMMMTTKITRRVIEAFDFSQFKHLWLNVGVDAGATTRYSEIAMVQTLDNLRRDGTLDIIEYLERIPDALIPRKSELIESIKKRTMQAQVNQPGTTPAENGQAMPGLMASGPGAGSKMGVMGGGGPTMGGPLESGKAISKMPESIQNKYNQLPQEAQKALLTKASL
ncbi:MAG: hypothetical protein EOM03_13300 [Clostridia bacterium]|nr:hypothetical protein [Clostridia bacterium]